MSFWLAMTCWLPPVAADAGGPDRMSGGSSEPIVFHIVAQPLSAALESYSLRSKRQVIYNGALAVGRQSAPVDGNFTPEVALRLLLEGSDLVPRYMAQDAFVLLPVRKPAISIRAAPNGLAERYFGLIQARLLQALCVDDRTRPGNYRLAFSFWLGTDGRLSRAVMLDTTGAPERDVAVEQLLLRFSVGAPPPAGFVQPVTFVVDPQLPLATGECEAVRISAMSEHAR